MSDDDPVAGRFGRPNTEVVRAVLLDMGGVVLDLGEGGGLPWGELERRGREELLARIAETGGQAAEADLDRLLFTPWRRVHDRRYRLGREAAWRPHVERLRRVTGSAVPPDRLLSAWAGPYLGSLRALSGVQETLARLVAADLTLALVSNVPLPGRYFERVLEEQGVASFFQSRHFSYDAGSRKPAPGLVQAAVAALGAEAEATVFVGDRRSTDVAAGRAAEITTVWVRSRDTDGPEPDAEIGSLAELPELLGI
jgi:FMN phosphatase YigB (HAD superfamily)